MPEAKPIPLLPPPGVVKEETDRIIEGRYSDSQWMRFVDGLAQKRRGFSIQTADASSGVMRALHAWRALDAREYIGAGTSKKLYVYERDFTQHDITPFSSTGTLGTDPFTTTSGSSLVTVAHTAHGRNSGDTAIYDGATATGGLTIDGPYSVLTADANTYVIDAGSTASSTATGGGASVTYQYEIPVGAEIGTYGLGFGTGRYGIGTWGTARTSSTLLVEPRVWSLINYGEDLWGAYNGGAIYTFDPADLSTNGRAEILTNSPTDVRAMFLTEERYPFALCDDMVVKWPDRNDPTIWTAAAGNTANSRRLVGGTKLVGGLALAQAISLVWSDFAAFLFQYTGSSSVYSSRKIAENCGLIGPHACCSGADGTAYWMSSQSFHFYNGSVNELPNVGDIKAFVFDRMRKDQPYLCWAYYDGQFDEVTFFYVLEGDDNPSFSVTYHIKDRCWTPNDWSDFPRVSATRFQHGDTRPYLAGTDGHIYFHEDGYNADGAAIEASLTIAPSSIEDGSQILDIDGVKVDLQGQVGNVTFTFTAQDALRGADIDSQTVTVAPTDELLDLRVSGRYASMDVTSNVIDGFFRWGKPIALVKRSGRRRG
jgi:hypothetical protein